MALQGKVRLYQVRRGDSLDDQRSPVEIQSAPSAASDQEQFQDALLSQVKRILWGDNPGHWYDNFKGLGLKSLSDLTASTATGGQVFEAACAATDTVGTFVRISGDEVDGLTSVTAVDITDSDKMPCVGVVVYKHSSTRCRVARDGRVSFTDLANPLIPGKRYFVGYDGRPTRTPPSLYASPTGYAMLQCIGVAASSSSLEFRPDTFIVRMDTSGNPPQPA